MKVSRSLFSVLLGITLTTTLAQAQLVGFTNSTGISAPGRTITFSEVPDGPWPFVVSTQYAPYGFTITPNLWQAGGTLLNFDLGIHLDFSLQFSFVFGQPVVAAGLEVFSAQPYSLSAYLGNTLAAQHVFDGSSQTSDRFTGFQSMGSASFDRMEFVGPENHLFFASFDNLQFTTAPEPASLAFCGFGLICIVGLSRFRRVK